MKIPEGINGCPSNGVPVQVSIGSQGGNSFVPRFLDE